jgi:hypothetical protein
VLAFQSLEILGHPGHELNSVQKYPKIGYENLKEKKSIEDISNEQS